MSLSGENASTFVQLKIKLDKKELRFAEANFQEANWPSWEMYLLDTDLNSLQNRSPVFFLEYSSKREIHNNMNHTNIKYLRCNMDCHLCGERHGSGADELLERLEGTQRAQRCALKRLTNQF